MEQLPLNVANLVHAIFLVDMKVATLLHTFATQLKQVARHAPNSFQKNVSAASTPSIEYLVTSLLFNAMIFVENYCHARIRVPEVVMMEVAMMDAFVRNHAGSS